MSKPGIIAGTMKSVLFRELCTVMKSLRDLMVDEMCLACILRLGFYLASLRCIGGLVGGWVEFSGIAIESRFFETRNDRHVRGNQIISASSGELLSHNNIPFLTRP